MNRFAGFKNFTQGIVFIAIIIFIFITIAYILLSIIGNISLSCSNKDIQAPSIEKAKYQVYVKATRKIYYTNHYELISGKIYQLHGYYEPVNGKYIYKSGTVLIDPDNWGDVRITKR